MFAREIQEKVKASTGVDISNTKIAPDDLPKTIEENGIAFATFV